MSPKGKLFTALAVVALTVPALASARQSYGQSQDAQSYGQPQPGYAQPDAGSQGYGQPQPGQGPEGYGQGPGPGDQQTQSGHKQGHKGQQGVYPQFRALEKHIKHSVREARQANALPHRDAHHLMAQLRQIQAEEMSAYQAHGMNLPPDVQARIQGELTQLAQAVDQGHGQPPYQGQQ